MVQLVVAFHEQQQQIYRLSKDASELFYKLVDEKQALKPPFHASDSRIKKLLVPVGPSCDRYHPKLLPKSRSCGFGIGRNVG